MSRPSPISIQRLIEDYDGLLLDAYGVLVDKTGALPGAADFIAQLHAQNKPYLLLTNSASRLPHSMSAELAQWGLPIPPERILTSGQLLGVYFREQGLIGSRCLVLGPPESSRYVEMAGGRLVPLGPGTDAEVVVAADQKGFPCIEGMNHTLSLMLRRLDARRPLHLLLCNPDLIYPVSRGAYGFTAGGLAAMLEAVLRERYPELDAHFQRLGKPYLPLFLEARRRIGRDNLVMVGDQLATDILGANRFGIDSVLVGSGLARQGGQGNRLARPTWYLESLCAAAVER